MVLIASFVPKAIPRQPTNNKHQSKNCWPLLRSGLWSAKWQRAGIIKAKRVQQVAPINDMMSANLGTRITVTPVNVTNKILKMAPNHLSSWKREKMFQTVRKFHEFSVTRLLRFLRFYVKTFCYVIAIWWIFFYEKE